MKYRCCLLFSFFFSSIKPKSTETIQMQIICHWFYLFRLCFVLRSITRWISHLWMLLIFDLDWFVLCCVLLWCMVYGVLCSLFSSLCRAKLWFRLMWNITIQFQWKWQIIIFHLLWIIQFIVYGLACIWVCVCVNYMYLCVSFIFFGRNVDCVWFQCGSFSSMNIFFSGCIHDFWFRWHFRFIFVSVFTVHSICQPVFISARFRTSSFRIFLSQSDFSTFLFFCFSRSLSLRMCVCVVCRRFSFILILWFKV